MILNPAKLGMCFNNAVIIMKDRANTDITTNSRTEFKNLVKELYLLSTECEEMIKDYEPEKRKLEYD